MCWLYFSSTHENKYITINILKTLVCYLNVSPGEVLLLPPGNMITLSDGSPREEGAQSGMRVLCKALGNHKEQGPGCRVC